MLVMYAVLLIALGFYRYVTDHNMIALVGGGVSGLLILGTVALSMSHPRPGRIGAAIITLLLLGHVGMQMIKEPNAPSIISFVASLVVIVTLAAGHFMAVSKKKSEPAE